MRRRDSLFCPAIALVMVWAVTANGCSDLADPADGGPGPAVPPACDPTSRLCEVAELCAGSSHACTRSDTGRVFCWGSNTNGEGGRTGGASSRPVRVEGLADVTRLSCGSTHTCALASGVAYCWGFNDEGQLGSGDRAARSSPTPVMGLDGVTAIDVVAGVRNSCVVSSARRVYCWGDNSIGQLGAGVPVGEDHTGAVALPDVLGVDAVGVGGFHVCARTGGHVSCWGNNFHGQLGDGTRDNSAAAVDVVDISDATALAVGDLHNCVRRSDGTVWCWGINEDLQLGSGTSGLSSVPLQTLDVAGADWVQGGVSGHTCAGDPTFCWGFENTYGELGDGLAEFETRPVPVVVEPPFTERLVPGHEFTCALIENGAVACWGLNDFGQLGDGMMMNRLTPSPVVAP